MLPTGSIPEADSLLESKDSFLKLKAVPFAMGLRKPTGEESSYLTEQKPHCKGTSEVLNEKAGRSLDYRSSESRLGHSTSPTVT